MGDLVNLIRREVARMMVRHAKPAVGVTDAYDQNAHAVKVKFLTELDDQGTPRISGWIPIRCQAAGAGASWVIGASPGDQAVVEYLEGDAENGVVTGFLHNDVDQPPVAASGQAILRHAATGNYFTLNTDGSFQWVHKATGNYHKLDASGNATTYISSPAQQHYLGGDPAKGGGFSPVMTAAGPSPYAKARIS